MGHRSAGRPSSRTLLRRAAPAARQDPTVRELRHVCLKGVPGMIEEIVRQVHEEHRQATAPDREAIREVRSRGGVCFPGGMTSEEWSNLLPRALRGPARTCIQPDELAQEFFDRGKIAEPSTDAVLDHLNVTYERARSKPSLPDEKELRREARRVVNERVKQAVEDLVTTASRQAKTVCPPFEIVPPAPEGGERKSVGGTVLRIIPPKARNCS